jgi:hypothetical protein
MIGRCKEYCSFSDTETIFLSNIREILKIVTKDCEPNKLHKRVANLYTALHTFIYIS